VVIKAINVPVGDASVRSAQAEWRSALKPYAPERFSVHGKLLKGPKKAFGGGAHPSFRTCPRIWTIKKAKAAGRQKAYSLPAFTF
jgi:hypothetical protein